MNDRISKISLTILYLSLIIVFMNSLFFWHGLCHHSVVLFLKFCLVISAVLAMLLRQPVWRWLALLVLVWDYTSQIILPLLDAPTYMTNRIIYFDFSDPFLFNLTFFSQLLEMVFVLYSILVLPFVSFHSMNTLSSFHIPRPTFNQKLKFFAFFVVLALSLYGLAMYTKGLVLKSAFSSCGSYNDLPPYPLAFFSFNENAGQMGTRIDLGKFSFNLPLDYWLESESEYHEEPFVGTLCSKLGKEVHLINVGQQEPSLEHEDWYEWEWERYDSFTIKNSDWWLLCKDQLERRLSILMVNSIPSFYDSRLAFTTNSLKGFVSYFTTEHAQAVEIKFSKYGLSVPITCQLVFKKGTMGETEIEELLNVFLNSLAIRASS